MTDEEIALYEEQQRIAARERQSQVRHFYESALVAGNLQERFGQCELVRWHVSRRGLRLLSG